ncbi:hypothetical protein LTR37_009479 [Vermiconidia calcicola]|uniref:Uncharacterized protein n=1 Tax=Vermiconidia calcicola TaxID=1690605 RepID=A0ACC3N887_9PEZI|nr:hypothetical protein LTR37_009479 [Vermiconidia calcicola]
MVVEITPIGIETLRWKFYIIWTVLNGSFVPFTYFLFPETAGRTLEDIDSYFRGQPSLVVFRDKLATESKRPMEFIEKEEQEVRRKSSVNERAMSLAQTHRRFSLMDENRVGGITEKDGVSRSEKM